MARWVSIVSIATGLALLALPGTICQQPLSGPGFMIGNDPHEFCEPGTDGDRICASISGSRPCCAPLAYVPWTDADKATAQAAYGAANFTSIGACWYCDPNSVQFNHSAVFTYSPDPRDWDKSAQPTYNALTTVNAEGDQQNGLSNTVSFSRATASTFTWTANQEIDAGASFSFELGGCGLCPASATTQFTFMLKVGFAETHTSTTTDQWGTSTTVAAKPGTCSASIMNVKAINNLLVGWVSDVNTTCSKTAIYSFGPNLGSNFTIPCSDIVGEVNRAAGGKVTAKLLSSTPPRLPSGPGGQPTFAPYQATFGGTALYEVTGTMTISYGTQVNSAICACGNSTCINNNLGFDFQTNTPGPVPPTLPANAAVLPKLQAAGVDTKGLGTVQPIGDDQRTCKDCTTVNSGTAPTNQAPTNFGAVTALQVTPAGAGAAGGAAPSGAPSGNASPRANSPPPANASPSANSPPGMNAPTPRAG